MSAKNHCDDPHCLRSLLCKEGAKDALEDYLLLKEQINEARSVSSTNLSFQNETWREMVSDWLIRIIDRIGMSREVSFHAMSILDRFLAIDRASRQNWRSD
eukprot:CAMPEP_0197444926 /NCGR_PEP_ID=MMETSP1175-20131217/10266_1 /TAXON_ID=1003142 /ORGANISM="Triceratium dubium, Strain CCMP147" /LENGTH=100 /DNA_ID=CAMNT_0042975795 /DNA_START=62 /DNA_END=361 /DNA_ORIENTATION=-